MRTSVSAGEMLQLFQSIHQALGEKKDRLTELDSAMGDGDLGVSMDTGFKAVVDEIAQLDETDIGTIFAKAGMALNRAAPSTLGTLLATGFIRAAKVAKGKAELGLADWTQVWETAREGMEQRGKAKVGDKTILDALVPYCEALRTAQDEDKSLPVACEKAAAVSTQAAENTKELSSKIGRAGWFGEKTVGKEDPGAVAFAIIVSGASRYFGNESVGEDA